MQALHVQSKNAVLLHVLYKLTVSEQFATKEYCKVMPSDC